MSPALANLRRHIDGLQHDRQAIAELGRKILLATAAEKCSGGACDNDTDRNPMRDVGCGRQSTQRKP